MSNTLEIVGVIIAIAGTILSFSTGLYFMRLNKRNARQKELSEDTDK